MSSRENCPTCRGEALIRWVGWHFLELVALGAPLALAATVNPWWFLVTVATAAAWIVHELRVLRRRRDTRSTDQEQPRLPAGSDEADGEKASAQRGKGVSA